MSFTISFKVVIDASKQDVYKINPKFKNKEIYVFFDPVDGTSKVAGIGNDDENKIFRTAGDGSWGIGIAFTNITKESLDNLVIGDFKSSVIVDGNPNTYKTYPQIIAATVSDPDKLESKEILYKNQIPIFTSSQKKLQESFVAYEPFQAFDRKTAELWKEKLAINLFRNIANRNNNGAFNLISFHSTFVGIQRLLLGWRNEPTWIEPQGTAYISINENLPNIVPVVPIIEEAGGVAIDFQGNRLAERKLIEGRTDVIYAANKKIAETILQHIKAAQKELNYRDKRSYQ